MLPPELTRSNFPTKVNTISKEAFTKNREVEKVVDLWASLQIPEHLQIVEIFDAGVPDRQPPATDSDD